jgi:hypothetical protein
MSVGPIFIKHRRARDRRAYEEKGLENIYKVGIKITMSSLPANGGKAREIRNS